MVDRSQIDNVDMPVLRFDNVCVGNVDKYNYLGVIVDNKFLFDHFIDAKYNKANLRFLQLRKLQKAITCEIAITIYKQMILPLLDYADFIVESARKSKVEKSEKLEERALKFVNNDQYDYNF